MRAAEHPLGLRGRDRVAVNVVADHGEDDVLRGVGSQITWGDREDGWRGVQDGHRTGGDGRAHVFAVRGRDLNVPCFTLRRGGGRHRQAGEGGLNRPVAEPGDGGAAFRVAVVVAVGVTRREVVGGRRCCRREDEVGRRRRDVRDGFVGGDRRGAVGVAAGAAVAVGGEDGHVKTDGSRPCRWGRPVKGPRGGAVRIIVRRLLCVGVDSGVGVRVRKLTLGDREAEPTRRGRRAHPDRDGVGAARGVVGGDAVQLGGHRVVPVATAASGAVEFPTAVGHHLSHGRHGKQQGDGEDGQGCPHRAKTSVCFLLPLFSHSHSVRR